MLATVLVATAFLFYLAQASQASVIELNISYLQVESGKLDAQNANLHAAAAGYQSLPRLSWIATNEFHMVPPDIRQTVWIRPVYPTVLPVPNPAADQVRARQRSQPIAWISRFAALVRSSL
jgi:hypothetical protein